MTRSASQKFRLTRRAFTAGLGAASLIACDQKAQSGKDADVIIVGAGLSGLFSALWLQDAGYKVLVVEGSNRIGGRLWTLNDLPGQPEAGGSQVGQSYARIRYAAERTGVDIIDDPAAPRSDRLLSFQDNNILQSEWSTSPNNPFPDAFKRAAPDSALFAAAAPDNPLDWAGAWRTPDAFSRDVTADAFLQDKGFSASARALVDMALNANSLDTYSMLNVWRSLQLFTQDSTVGPSGYIAGGAQRLPEAMAAMIDGNVRNGFKVQSITHDNNTVTVSDGSEKLTSDFCIVALPFPAVAKIAFDPASAGAQADAIKSLPYTQILQLHLETVEPFWEQDGLPASMWTDGPLERVFTSKDRTTGEIVGLLAWINGTRATSLSMASDADLETLVQQEMASIRPASNGNIRLRKAVRWLDGDSYAGGAYMHWGPGQAVKWATQMSASNGRIHFAGEHLSHLHTGMEGAMESGQNAATAITEATQ